MDYDLFRGPLKLGKQGENEIYFRNMVKRGWNWDLLRAPLKLLIQKKNGVGHNYVYVRWMGGVESIMIYLRVH
jgi:hypothetical protein